MRFLFKLLVISFIYISCDPSDETIQDEFLNDPTSINTENLEEYILINLESKQFIFGAERKKEDESDIGAKLVTKFASFGEKYHSLIIWGSLKDDNYREFQRIGASIDKFEGVGLYETGTTRKNNCNFFHFGISWHSHYDIEESGFIEITSADEENITGNFDMMLYNANDRSQSRNISGEFSLKLD